eukprot:GHVU01049395.1.p1 GENE.GHVU01049395.1~~GHVU01049395.1.p1  ORF type:complete len:137 (-),score=4.38 GHVU01049395.1:162-572(-)
MPVYAVIIPPSKAYEHVLRLATAYRCVSYNDTSYVFCETKETLSSYKQLKNDQDAGKLFAHFVLDNYDKATFERKGVFSDDAKEQWPDVIGMLDICERHNSTVTVGSKQSGAKALRLHDAAAEVQRCVGIMTIARR